jgi:hypothetical protein
MEAEWCTEVLKEAIAEFGKPKIFNTDQVAHRGGGPLHL